MLESFPICLLVGTVLGFLAGLGVGGGSLLITWLTGVLSLPYPQARTLNLLFFLPCALTATLVRQRMSVLRLKKLLPATIAGSISAVLFFWLSRYVPAGHLRQLFGIFLVITGVHELFIKGRNQPQA